MDKPDLYSKYSDLQRSDNLFVLDNYLDVSGWKAEDAVLDVGSGDGKFLIENLYPRLPENIGKLVGSDCSEIMVNFAKERYSVDEVEFAQLDISSQELPPNFENGFDHIFSFYTLHWVREQRQTYDNMYKILKPGGDMLLTFLASNGIYDIYLNMAKNKRWKPYSKKEYIAPFHGMKNPEKQLEKLLKKSGFKCNVCKVENRLFAFRNLDSFRKSVIAVNPIIPNLPPEDVSDYMDDYVKEARGLTKITIENMNNNAEESVSVDYKLFVVHATKPETVG
ncbi:juvenile hormone acid O-methyltransferase [Leptinotarsa decemlineata]|uniref:Juvenile hormone acid methyltransferase n=2 Tax=Leptinotarsa decemlineata TaxID=7539 RepID=A0A0H4SZT2_LEPDE|nr:juvenile hormone acid methyltransferase [Leptinotarsa decemlineata]